MPDGIYTGIFALLGVCIPLCYQYNSYFLNKKYEFISKLYSSLVDCHNAVVFCSTRIQKHMKIF